MKLQDAIDVKFFYCTTSDFAKLFGTKTKINSNAFLDL